MKKAILLIIILLLNCASEKDACYKDLNNPGITEEANSCENFIIYSLATPVLSESSGIKSISNLNLIQCLLYIQQGKECKKKSNLFPRLYIRS